MTEEVTKEGMRDLVAMAFLMSVITKGDKQVTLANYQRKKVKKTVTMPDGTVKEVEAVEDVPVITDLNIMYYTENNAKLSPDIKNYSKEGNSKLITNSRKTRQDRFRAIREHMEERRRQQGQNGRMHAVGRRNTT